MWDQKVLTTQTIKLKKTKNVINSHILAVENTMLQIYDDVDRG